MFNAGGGANSLSIVLLSCTINDDLTTLLRDLVGHSTTANRTSNYYTL